MLYLKWYQTMPVVTIRSCVPRHASSEDVIEDELLDRCRRDRTFRLAMDFDQPRKIGGVPVVKSVIIGEPDVRPRQCKKLARTFMIEREGGLLPPVEHALDAGK